MEEKVKILSYNTVIVGTGASGYNAADCLYQKGQKDIVIITEHKNAGTSRNTGSDKQTYYKLSLAGDTPDSVAMLADVLFHGECVDGDIALCEAALSAQGFYKLVGLGVPFPKNSYGEYIGYKTDHDPSKRATSVGPYTSKIMTECLEKSVEEKKIPIMDGYQVLRILTDGEEQSVLGLLCLEVKSREYVLVRCSNVIYATGGPAGMYADSVYPLGHYGASGIAFLAGVQGKNLTEWQYGIASIKPRWNVSGTYMQSLPKFVSTNQDGSDKKEFLLDFFSDRGEMLSKIFMKGYQWPFDVRKIDGGSSIVDVLVYIESCMKGRRVFLDFRENSEGKELDASILTEEAREYLVKAGACFGSPIERLEHMNHPAMDFYLDKGVDLRKQMLEIALCAQHNNGGLVIDKWWQTNVKGFFAVGEVSGSHGVYRPGGSALNAGQVGSARAAEYIAAKGNKELISQEAFLEKTKEQIATALEFEYLSLDFEKLDYMWKRATKRMSKIGAAIRSKEEIEVAIIEILQELQSFDTKQCEIKYEMLNKKYLWKIHRLYDMLLSQYVYLSAMSDYSIVSSQSRGSALYTSEDGNLAYETLPEVFRFQLDDGRFANQIQEIELKDLACTCTWREVRKIPIEDNFFENVWREFRKDGNIH
ncbi:MAG: FAD-binding protein [Lachnospiraceae bacterium]